MLSINVGATQAVLPGDVLLTKAVSGFHTSFQATMAAYKSNMSIPQQT
jgi:hypothetical protein